ncbi:DNA mismatch endonuclease Vsr [Duganella sp. FT80W]|uniref:Very short patch repair endonuclease n=1 Tax=Duganella guangzhouensis TaxID=2666084 RepID=A0A6I2KXC6_9BURK|nr:very short patch repair endonuclease [Duganella guangzhouensis]MRW90180.1 DNA mismatch endonuclease Vsr [Duganella guangzhouensis]
MTDVHTPERRSRNMQAIRGKNTRPEVLLRKLLFSRGFRYRLHVSSLPGKPDIVLPKHRTVIFVQGCFWHGHDCHLFTLPQTRREFWLTKIRANQQRDQRNVLALRSAGWRVICVWECALRGRLKWDEGALLNHLTGLITQDSTDAASLCIRHR